MTSIMISVNDTRKNLVQQAVGLIPWGHNVTIINKIKDINKALWYATKSFEQGWSRNMLFNYLKLHSYVVIELKTRESKPEYIGKEKSNRYHQLVFQPASEQIISISKAAELENITINELQGKFEKA